MAVRLVKECDPLKRVCMMGKHFFAFVHKCRKLNFKNEEISMIYRLRGKKKEDDRSGLN